MNMRKLMAVAVIAASATLPMAANAEAKSVRLVCNSYTGSTPLTNFQALVKLSATDDAYGFSYSEAGGASATNIWFTSADGSAVYPHEIDTWDTAADSFVWVRIPVLTNGADVVMHWSDSASDVQTASGNVWDGYVGVWHMNETGTTAEPDSTGNALSATPINNSSASTSINSATGAVGAGRSVAQATMMKVSGHASNGRISNAQVFTIGGWVKRTTDGDEYPRIFVGNANNSSRNKWEVYGWTDNKKDTKTCVRGSGNTDWTTTAIILNTAAGWHYLTVVYNGTNATIYDNGSSKESKTINAAAQGDYFTIGGVSGSNNRSFVGTFDEVRMYNGVLSADRVAADYATMNDPTAFLVAASDDTIVTATWTGAAGDGDVSNTGNWVCRNGSGSVVEGVPSSVTAVTVSGDDLNFQVPASATFEYNTLTFGDCTLGRSCDWTGLGDVAIPSGATIDLKGHALFVQGLTGGGVITNTANAAYTTLDFIQADNNNASQYIITDYTPRYSDTFITKVSFQSIVNQCIYCARGNGVASGSYSCLTYTNNKLRFDHVNSQGGESITPPTDADCTLIVNGKAGACKLNGTLIEKNMATASDDTATAASVLSFFVLNNSASGTAMSTYYRQANFKMYYFRIYDVDGEIVRDYVPAKNGSGVAGLWERVHGTFWASNGGTAFVAGGETNRGEVVFCGTGVWSGVEIAPAVAVVKEDFGGTLTRSGLLKPGMSGAGTASFVFNNGTATLSDGIQAGTAEFNVYGGTVNVPNFIDWGKRAGKTAVWNQYGGDVTQSGGNFWIGAYGASGAVGIYNLSGGTPTMSGDILTLGQDPGHTGYFNMTNGTLTCNVDIDVGEKGVGHFTLSGGTLNEKTTLRVGRYSGSVGTFGQSGGAATVNSYLQLGAEEGSTGTYTMTAGTLGVPKQPIAVGRYGTGLLDVSGAAVVTAAKGVRVGFSGNGTGTLVVTNGGTIATSSIYAGGTAAAQASVLFDNATVKATAAGDILKDLQDVTIGADGLALNVQTYAAVVTNTTLKVTSGTTAITMAGTGSLDLSKATVELSSTPTGKFTLAVATGNGTFIGVPAVVGAGGATVNGYRACLSSDGKSVEVRRRGFMILVK